MTVDKVSNRYVLPAKDRKFVTVHKDTHEAIKAFASVRNISIVEATQYLLTKAIKESEGELE